MLKEISIAHAVVVIGGAIALYLFSHSTSLVFSWLLGGLMMNLNLQALSWAWSLIFQKKLIALAVSIIVIKYAILAGILFSSLSQAWFHALAFGAGIASLMIVLTGTLLISRKAYGV